MMESTSVTALSPDMADLNPCMLSDSEMISIPPLDPLFLSSSAPISMDPSISDLDFLLEDENGNFPDLDFSFDDSDDFFNFTLDAEPAVVIPEEFEGLGDQKPEAIENHSSLDLLETRKGDRGSERRSDSVHSQVSSQGSKTIVSGACDTVDALSSPETSNLGLHQKSSVSKRKKEKGDPGVEYRSFKYQKSDDKSADTNEEDDDKKKTRLIRNRESAHLSRLRKKQYVEELQEKVKSMNSIIAELNGKISYVMAENVALKQQMASASGAPPMNPYMAAPPLPYQWMPYPMYPVRGYGSQNPVFPIPKLKPKPVSGCRPKKLESKKNEGKSRVKKVASISFVGIMFFVFLFGTLVPYMNEKYEGESESFSGLSNYEGRRYYDEHKGKVLMVGDGSDVKRESGISEGGAISLRNSSEPLVASLYVPRNDGLVKIDGNLIINSALASEKAMAFANKKISETVGSKELDLTGPGGLSSALAVPEARGNGAMLPHSKALSSGSSEGKRLQQWFHEGTLMESFMCTEVFQFDIAPGAIVPSSVSNITREHLEKVTTHDKKMKNRRTLEGLPVSLMASDLNFTKSQNKSFHGNTNKKPTSSSSSMVVSVLLDPREIADSETERVMPSNSKSLSRIFVVVLLDSVKYVTYSCVLPRSGLHLVAT